MFATTNIACGDLIISHEEPVVQCSSRPNLAVCSSCVRPIGTLRKDHLKAENFDAPLLYLDNDDLIFTTSHTKCEVCNDAVWCSDQCYQKCKEQHSILCTSSSNTLKEFYDNCCEENTTIFQLAAKAVVVSF